MDGPEIFKFAVRVVGETLDHLLKKGELQPTDLDHLFLHQANLRIIESIRKRLKLPREKVPVNIDRYGNMSSATIPIALYERGRCGPPQEEISWPRLLSAQGLPGAYLNEMVNMGA